MEGKCHKGSDCLYSHDVAIPKRKELCKFYLQGFCGMSFVMKDFHAKIYIDFLIIIIKMFDSFL